MNETWRPLPDRLIRALVRVRFSKEHQASEVEAWALAYLALQDGKPLTQRAASELFGWGEWRCRKFLDEVRAWKDEWDHAEITHPIHAETTQPTQVESAVSDVDHAENTQKSRKNHAPPRARVPLLDRDKDSDNTHEEGSALASGDAHPSRPAKKEKPPEDPRLRQATDIWVEILRESGRIGPDEPSGLRMTPGPNGVDRKARQAVVDVAGLTIHNGHDRQEALRAVVRCYIRLAEHNDPRLWPRDGAVAFDRLPRLYSVLQGVLKERPDYGLPRVGPAPGPFEYDEATDAPF